MGYDSTASQVKSVCLDSKFRVQNDANKLEEFPE